MNVDIRVCVCMYVCVCVCVCVCMFVCVCVCVCLRPSTVKALYVWGWSSRGQINDVVLKTFLSSVKSLHRYFSMKHRAFLISLSILLPLSGIVFAPRYILSRSAYCVSTHGWGHSLNRKG